jgi:hypothetical protein
VSSTYGAIKPVALTDMAYTPVLCDWQEKTYYSSVLAICGDKKQLRTRLYPNSNSGTKLGAGQKLAWRTGRFT